MPGRYGRDRGAGQAHARTRGRQIEYYVPGSHHWFDNYGNENTIQLVAGHKYSGEPDILGHAKQALKTSVVYVGYIFDTTLPAFVQLKVADVTVHELGHQFGLNEGMGDHVDLSKVGPLEVDRPNHEGSDQCVMAYTTNRTDDHCEFCADDKKSPDRYCIWGIRGYPDPLP